MYGGSVCALLERTVCVEQTLCTAQSLALQAVMSLQHRCFLRCQAGVLHSVVWPWIQLPAAMAACVHLWMVLSLCACFSGAERKRP